ncbi:MAG TPA: autotransporter-associated beta strand repeat-containing protein [Fimbriiglobus sp.]
MKFSAFRFVAPVAVCSAFFWCSQSASAQVNLGANFQTQKMSDNQSFNVTPPDTVGSISPDYWVQVNNGLYSFFRKDGTQITTVPGAQANGHLLDTTFWKNAGLSTAIANAAAGDSRMLYDPLSNHWFTTAFTGETTNNKILIARSDTADPTGTWKATSFATNISRFADYPTLGIDGNGIYIGTNNFTSGGSFSSVSILSIPKADLLLATPSVANISAFQGESANTRGFTLQGVTNYNPGQTGTMQAQMLSTSSTSGSQLNLTTLSGTSAAGATIVSTVPINVTSFPAPPTAKQPNPAGTAQSSTTLDSLGTRIVGSVYRVGDLTYLVHGTSASSHAALRVTVLDSTTNAVVAESTIGDSQHDYFLGTVAANAHGDVVVGYSRSGFVASGDPGNLFAGSYATIGTLAGGTLTFGSPTLLRAGTTEFLGPAFDSGNPKRWGDYSATNLDPSDPGIFWTAQEFALAARDWGTQTTEIIPTVTGEVRWKAAAAGDASDGTNWFNGVAAIATDHAIFSRWSTTNYTVTVPDSIAYNRLSVRQTGPGTLTFALGTPIGLTLSSALTTEPSLAISEFQGNSTVSFTGGIVNAQTVIVAGQSGGFGTLRVENGATFTVGGNLHLGGTAAATGGTGSLVVDGSAAAAAVSVTGNLNFWQTSASATVTSATLTVGGLTNQIGSAPTVTLTNASAALVVNGSGTATFGGVVAGAGTVAKSGAGTQTFTGANTYSGNTAVFQGTLALSGSGSIANSATVTVEAGAILDGSAVTGGANHDGTRFALANGQTLKGNGTVAGPLGIQAGATLAPGSSPGKLTVTGGLVFTGGTLQIAITGPTPGTEYSQVEVNGGVINLGAGVASLSFPSPSGSFSGTSEIVIVHATGAATFAGGSFAGLPNGAAVPELAGLGGQPAWYVNYGVEPGSGLLAGNDILLTPVPEPVSGLGLAASGFVLGWFRFRRSNGAEKSPKNPAKTGETNT